MGLLNRVPNTFKPSTELADAYCKITGIHLTNKHPGTFFLRINTWKTHEARTQKRDVIAEDKARIAYIDPAILADPPADFNPMDYEGAEDVAKLLSYVYINMKDRLEIFKDAVPVVQNEIVVGLNIPTPDPYGEEGDIVPTAVWKITSIDIDTYNLTCVARLGAWIDEDAFEEGAPPFSVLSTHSDKGGEAEAEILSPVTEILQQPGFAEVYSKLLTSLYINLKQTPKWESATDSDDLSTEPHAKEVIEVVEPVVER
jgi:hypothetical protein